MEQLLTKQKNSVRNHPVFGLTEYGLGVTIDTSDNLLMVGQTGFVPGYVTENYYFPKNHVGVTVLSNVDYNSGGFKGSFRYHTAILNIVRKYLQHKNKVYFISKALRSVSSVFLVRIPGTKSSLGVPFT